MASPRKMDRLALLIAVLAAGLINHEVSGAETRLGVLIVTTESGDDVMFCIKYFPELSNLTATAESADSFALSDLADLAGVETCDGGGGGGDGDDGDDLPDLKDKLALISARGMEGNCSIAERAQNLQSQSALGLLADSSVPTRFNASSFDPVGILVAALVGRDAEKELLELKQKHPGARFIVYGPRTTPKGKQLDLSILLILSMAVFTVAVGSLWSGHTKHNLRLQSQGLLAGQQQQRSGRPGAGGLPGAGGAPSGNAPNPQAHANDQEDVAVQLTPCWVVFFVFCMCAMLVLLYFFFNYLVYIIIGMFVLASMIATYACLEPLVMHSYAVLPSCPPRLMLPKCNLYLCRVNMELRQFVLFVFSVSVSVTWFFIRNEEYGWVLQDILGILFSINMLKVLRLPSFMICTVLLSILFFYDIFFVFITPLFTKDGKSVMVEVATGGNTGEQLPMVLKVPQFAHSPLSACWLPYSLLGFGDILVPGLLLSYCHSFDLLKQTPCKIYWTLSNIFYTLSLLMTFVSLFLMGVAQPALLYIVPGTLIPVALLALCRGEFREFWEGEKPPGLPTTKTSSPGPSPTSSVQPDEEQGQEEEPGNRSPEPTNPGLAEESPANQRASPSKSPKRDDSEQLLG